MVWGIGWEVEDGTWGVGGGMPTNTRHIGNPEHLLQFIPPDSVFVYGKNAWEACLVEGVDLGGCAHQLGLPWGS